MKTPSVFIIAKNVLTPGPNGPANGTFLPEIAHTAHEPAAGEAGAEAIHVRS
jgi:hypothetical protein